MNKKLIEKKYNRQLNIFLGIYITLCLLFALLFNGFFVKTKAYQGDFPDTTIRGSCSYNNTIGVVDWKFKQINDPNVRSIWYVPEPENEDSKIYLLFNYNGLSYTRTIVVNNGIGWYSNFNSYTSKDRVNTELGTSLRGDERAFEIKMGGDYEGNPYKCDFDFATLDSIEYVTTVEDVNKFFNNSDDTVINVGNPFEDSLILDNSLPLPQKVSVTEVPLVAPYVPSGQNGASIQASWINPNKFGDDDLQELCIQVKFSATYKAYSSILGIPKGKFTTPFTEIKTININNPNVNKMIDHYISYGINDIPFSIVIDSQGYNKTFTSYEDMALYSNVTDTFSSNGLDPFGYTPNHTLYELIKGTKFSIRYKLGNKVSYWVDVNYSGNNITSNETTFSDNNNETVDPDDVNYDYPANSINPSDNNLSIMNFFDKLSASIGSIFSSTNQYFDEAQQGTGSFFNFFKAFWDEFPAFFALLLLGLVIAILLRILGR